MLVAFAKACTEEKYEYWIKERMSTYYFLAGLNTLLYFTTIAGGLYAFNNSNYGILSFLGMSLAIFEILATTPLIGAIITSYYYIYLKFSCKPKDQKYSPQL